MWSHAALHGCQLLYFTLHFVVVTLVLVKVSLLRISLCMQTLIVQVVLFIICLVYFFALYMYTCTVTSSQLWYGFLFYIFYKYETSFLFNNHCGRLANCVVQSFDMNLFALNYSFAGCRQCLFNN